MPRKSAAQRRAEEQAAQDARLAETWAIFCTSFYKRVLDVVLFATWSTELEITQDGQGKYYISPSNDHRNRDILPTLLPTMPDWAVIAQLDYAEHMVQKVVVSREEKAHQQRLRQQAIDKSSKEDRAALGL